MASGSNEHKEVINQINSVLSMLKENDISREEVCDGSHTFKELYYHRMILFSIICNLLPHKSWKSKKHSNGEVWEGFFIVGITTPEGEYTYHYKDEHFGMFKVVELEQSPEYDGHNSRDITRLLSLLGDSHGKKRAKNP